MAIATPESYADMIDRAKAGGYAIPAINVTSSQTLSAALQGFTEAESDGIVQVSNGGAAYWSGSSRADRVKGSRHPPTKRTGGRNLWLIHVPFVLHAGNALEVAFSAERTLFASSVLIWG